MTVIATASNPRFSVSRVDIDRGGPTYTIDTLRDLAAASCPTPTCTSSPAPTRSAEIFTWRDADELFELAHFVGCTRPGYDDGPRDARGHPERPGHDPGDPGAGDLVDRLPRAPAARASRSGTSCPTASCSTSPSTASTHPTTDLEARTRAMTATDHATRAGPRRRPGGLGQAGREHRRLRRLRAARHHRRVPALLGAQRPPGEVDRRRDRGQAARDRRQAGTPRGRARRPLGAASTTPRSSCTCSTTRSARSTPSSGSGATAR